MSPEAMRTSILIPFSAPPLRTREALYCLYAIQQWEAFNDRRIQAYSPKYFYEFKNIEGMLNGLGRISRETALKHLAEGVCIAFDCGISVALDRSRLDHIIPRARNGTDSLENSTVLCRPHNSSKGTKDLLEWWLDKEWPAPALDRRVLCLYARIMWQSLDNVALDADAPASMQQFVKARLDKLPTEDHRIALYGSSGAAMLYLRWSKEPRI